MTELTIFEAGPETLFGVGRVEQAAVEVTGSMPTGRPYVGPDGRPCIGSLGVLIDNVLGYVIIDSLAGGAWSISTEIWLDMVGRLPEDGSRVTATASTIRADHVSGFSTGVILDAHGTLLGLCRQRGRAIAESPEQFKVPAYDTPGPAITDVAGLLGLVAHGPDSMTMPVTPALLNPRSMLHGGVSLCASEVVAAASRSALDPRLVTTSVHIVHARAVPAGACVDFRATTRHAGRTLWITEVTGYVGGRAATLARVSAESL